MYSATTTTGPHDASAAISPPSRDGQNGGPLSRLGSLPRSSGDGGGGGGGTGSGEARKSGGATRRALGRLLRTASAGWLGGGVVKAERHEDEDDARAGAGGGRARRSPPPPPQQQQRPLGARAPGPAGKAARAAGQREELASGAAFCAASLAMTLLNKAALSPRLPAASTSAAAAEAAAPSAAADPSAPLALPVVSLLAFQCLCTLLLTYAACALGLGRAPRRLGARELRLWLPVNALFAAMVATSFLALRHMGVPMLTVLKNLTSLLVIAGDRVVFGKTYGAGVWLALGLMTVSALCAAASDLEFSAPGYGWQLANNAATAAYSLALRVAIVKMGEGGAGGGGGGSEGGGGGAEAAALEAEDGRRRPPSSCSGGGGIGGGGGKGGAAGGAAAGRHHHHLQDGKHHGPPRPPDDVGMVVYNNLGALPMLALLAVASGEPSRLLSAPPGALRALASDRRFVAAALCSSATGFLLSVASMWFMRCTTATTFSLVGSLNKVPLAVLGALLFAPPPGRPPAWSSPGHVASVAVGLCAGAVFARAKSREDRIAVDKA